MFLGGEKNEMFSKQASASIECVRSSFTFTSLHHVRPSLLIAMLVDSQRNWKTRSV